MNSFNDKPIEGPEDDQFGFSPFAEALAQAIIKNENPEGTVMAIHGPWGSGKSRGLTYDSTQVLKPLTRTCFRQ
ncbi:MAG: hypothetical protein F4099_07160 [Synechococcus sp. SB0673_bin_10]|nr:P-loop NTPase fold protein [Cyanobacteria bacterium MAG IRC1_bin_28]MDE0648640.1 P-loop NTPase fold protein [Cyanobacteria bacterium MAG IRC4_bin_6]MYG64586.1 hypothetical protein [Synechococcus sp. SB0675_bin_7]MYI72269.1 hypothetical protein [Synechococcus sp. SB0673_bin_10]MYK86081.1 hypothetical protein [Synechococcus sp. SB0669_bin_7]